MTKKELFKTGILSHDFETVLQVLGEKKAILWAERCLSFFDHFHNGQTYPLTNFPFQKTFLEWESKNKIAHHGNGNDKPEQKSPHFDEGGDLQQPF